MAKNQGTDNAAGDQNWERVQAILGNPGRGPGDFTNREWATAGEQMDAIREQIRANPRAAAVEAQTFAEITNRVRVLQSYPQGTRSHPTEAVGSTPDQLG